jgi:hypothetical protein
LRAGAQIDFATNNNPYSAVQMTLDTSGNLGLGVTPSAWLWPNGTAGALQLQSGAALSGYNTSTYLSSNWYYNGGEKYIGNGFATRYEQSSGRHAWYTAGNNSSGAGATVSWTQAMTLDASSNLSIGTTANLLSSGTRTTVSISGSSSSAVALGVGGTRYGHVYADSTSTELSATSGYLYFTAGSAERARITSGGDLLVGTTTQPVGAVTTKLAVVQSTADYSTVINNTNASPYGLYIKHNTDSNGSGNPFIVAVGNATTRFAVRSDGGIENYSANNVNLSDRREKTNFAPAKSYLDTICAIPVQTFNYIDQAEDDPGLTLGVVAQDVQAVAPELVMESNWGTEDNPKMRLSIYQTDLQYALMKCIQEQQALINDLRARVAALESNP